MRLAISNLAWDAAEDAAIAALLRGHGVDAIDIAHGKYFPDPALAADADLARLRRWWAEHGIEITGMQALLFGTAGLNMFGPAPVRAAMLAHLDQVCRIGAALGAARLVFGSPRNRDRSGLDDAAAQACALDFFTRLGDLAAGHGVTVCLEPNPARYGANFMTGSDATAQVVRAVGHRAIRMQFDTGALAVNAEDPQAVLAAHAGLIGHIHASEPDLLPLGEGGCDHAAMAAAVARYLPGHLVTIEMLATGGEPHLASVGRALAHARRHYGAAPAGVAP